MSKEDLLYRVDQEIKCAEDEIKYYSEMRNNHTKKILGMLIPSSIAVTAENKALNASERLNDLRNKRDRIRLDTST